VSKVAHYLQEHLLGEVTASPEVRKHFAEDASILRMAPAIVVYPRNESDIRKTARFAWQLAQRGRPVPITARGGGSDTSGAAVGKGIMLVFTAHMNKILALDPRKQTMIVEPGATYDKLEQTLYTHGLFLPPYPASQHYATIGGGIANNSAGEKSVKYGVTGGYIKSLRVVLANGEVIETGPISKRELNRKLGMSTFEGEIYRSLDALLEENAEIIASERNLLKMARNTSGYNIFDVKKGHSFDLTPLFIGSQGSLGITTEATLEVVEHNPVTTSALVSLDKLDDLTNLLPKIMELKPSICDMLNKSALAHVASINPNQLNGVLQQPKAEIHLFIEFDDFKDGAQKKKVKKLGKIVNKNGASFKAVKNPEEQEKLWKLRQSVTTILTQPHGQSKAVPVAEDICVPVPNLVEFMKKASEIYAQAGLRASAWGHAGDGVVRMQPVFDLGQLGDRQKLFKLADEVYKAATSMGGTITAYSGDGRVKAPYMNLLYGSEVLKVMAQVKKIFDPHNILNPGVKNATLAEVKNHMRGDYNLGHHHQYMPRN
jgi:FAD/FMN-containing dehydrogenase